MSILFDATYYMDARPDVLNAYINSGAQAGTGMSWAAFAEQHYNNHGWKEGYNPNATFNTKEYLDANLDVLEAGVNPFQHYLTHGLSEGRAPNAGTPSRAEFDWETYVAANQDLQDAGIDTLEEAYTHFITHGQFEERDGKPVIATPGDSYLLTTGIDTINGTSGDDTILGSDAAGATAFVLGALDVIDGGLGNDTLKIADAATAAGGNFSFNGATIKNVENLEVTTNGSFDVAANTGLDLKGFTGLTSATLKAAGSDNSLILAASTTDVNLTVAGNATAGVTGGKAVSVSAGAGLVTVQGDALTNVSIKGGATGSSVTNTVAGAGTAGTTLTNVSLESIAAGTAAVSGNAVTNLTVKNQASALATTVTNATSTSLNVNVDNAGYTSAGAAVAGVSVAAGAAATTVNLNALSKSNIAVSGAAVKTLNIAGSGDLTLSAPTATATKIDGSAATGALTLGTLNAATVNVSTGSGNDSLTLSATAKATVDTGAGNDTITLGSAVAAGSTVSLGAGDDKLLAGTGGSVAASTAAAVTLIDAGDGFDTVSASLINAANAAQFKNFEALDVTAAVANLDVELMTGSTIEALTLSGSNAGGSQVSNVAAGVGLIVSGDNSAGSTNIKVKGAASATDNSFAIAFDGADVSGAAAVASNVKAGAVVLNEIESVSINSTGGSNTWNSITLTDDKLKTLTITGDKNLDLAFTGTNGTNGASGGAVSLIDGSAATGKLSINTTSVTADSATAGLTVKGGSAADVITLAQKATVDAGAGDDTIVSASAGGTFTGGLGNDKFDVALATMTAGNAGKEAGVVATIADFSAGDAAKLLAGTTAFTATKVALDDTVQDLDAALALAVGAANVATWFQYGTNTYIVSNDGDVGFDGGELVVKLTGLVDLSTATLDTTTDYLTLA